MANSSFNFPTVTSEFQTPDSSPSLRAPRKAFEFQKLPALKFWAKETFRGLKQQNYRSKKRWFYVYLILNCQLYFIMPGLH